MIHVPPHNEKTPEFGFTRSQTLWFIPQILPMTLLNLRFPANPYLRVTTQTVPENMTDTYQHIRVGSGETKYLTVFFLRARYSHRTRCDILSLSALTDI